MSFGVGELWDSGDEAARAAKLAAYERAWGLTPDGEPFSTHSSWLIPVRADGAAAMLKVPTHPEERAAMAAMAWFEGEGAARVLRIDGEAILMERLADDEPLKAMAEGGRDDEGTAILARAALRLHQPKPAPFPVTAPSLRRWFRALPKMVEAGQGGDLVREGWRIAQGLLSAPFEPVLLHGDIHHDNVMHDPARGWAAIDPKGIVGPPGYDFANMLCNPLGELPLKPGRMGRQARVVAEVTGRAVSDILSWVVAYTALSTAWYLESDRGHADRALSYCRVAQRELAEAGV